MIYRDLAACFAAFGLLTLLALAVGVANLGTAMTFGQIGFIVALGYVLVRL